MKQILICSQSFTAGGVEKSLISFLTELEAYHDEFEIDLLVIKPEGMFSNQVPQYVNIIDGGIELRCIAYSLLNKKFWLKFNLKGLAYKLCSSALFNLIAKKRSAGFQQQFLWKIWKNAIPELDKHYDVAISYTNGLPNYLVIDKVRAERKILWIHNEYKQLGYDRKFDERYYSQADRIVTISESCVQNFVEVFPEFIEKTQILENISSAALIRKMATQRQNDDVFSRVLGKKAVLLSIGRLDPQKGFDMALRAAQRLKIDEFDFIWFVIGAGDEYKELVKLRMELDLENEFVFLGLRENPYYYIANCDIFVQPSRFEGKSIVLDEAKILAKPILVTNYTTVYDSITDNRDGIIVPLDAIAIADGIKKLYTSPEMKQRFIMQLIQEKQGNEKEINNYISLIRGD